MDHVAQRLKDDVRARIAGAALQVFAARGFPGATMAGIARKARTATGNVYRYFPDKTALFDAVLPRSFARTLKTMIRRRVEALDGVADVTALAADAPFHAFAEELLRFSIENRLRVVVLLGRAEGTRHERFAGDLLRVLQRLASRHFRGVHPSTAITGAMRFALDHVYRSWMRTMIATLEELDDEQDLRAAVEAYSRYHLAGLNALFGGGSRTDSRRRP